MRAVTGGGRHLERESSAISISIQIAARHTHTKERREGVVWEGPHLCPKLNEGKQKCWLAGSSNIKLPLDAIGQKYHHTGIRVSIHLASEFVPDFVPVEFTPELPCKNGLKSDKNEVDIKWLIQKVI